jgi:hypothetical protein
MLDRRGLAYLHPGLDERGNDGRPHGASNPLHENVVVGSRVPERDGGEWVENHACRACAGVSLVRAFVQGFHVRAGLAAIDNLGA